MTVFILAALATLFIYFAYKIKALERRLTITEIILNGMCDELKATSRAHSPSQADLDYILGVRDEKDRSEQS